MSPRERILAIVVLSVVIVGFCGFMVQAFVLSPLQKSGDAITALQDQIEKKTARVKEIQAEEPSLERWKSVSLPSDINVSRLEYDKWLTNLVQRKGFVNATVTPKPVDLKTGVTATGQAAAKAAPVYAKYGYSVSGRATLANLVNFLEEFYSTGLLHQVRSISIQRPVTQVAQQRRNELDINLTIEALSLTNADMRKALLPVMDPRLLLIATFGAWRQAPVGLAFIPDELGPRGMFGPGKLAREPVSYREIAKKDIFVGRGDEPDPSYDVDANRYYKLTDIIESQELKNGGVKKLRQANMFDLFNNRKVHLQVEKDSYSSEFATKDEQFNTIFRGAVVKINDLDVIFQELSESGTPVKDKYYRIKVGGNMQEALRKPLTTEEITREGLAKAAAAAPAGGKDPAAEEDQEAGEK
jgi:hypothetical protein